MGLEFLPTPAYLALILSCSIIMFYFVVKYVWPKEKMAAFGLSLLALSGLGVASIRAIEENFREVMILTTWFFFTSLICSVAGIYLILLFLWRKTKEDPAGRKLLVVCLSILIICLLVIGLVVLIA